MKNLSSRKRAWRAAIVVLSALAAVPAQAQIPDEFKNLKVLPKGIVKQDLVREMRNMAGALGVRCVHCHVGEDNPNLEGIDFASDEKGTKLNARVMMRMVEEINGKLLSGLQTGRSETIKVECLTCHHGLAIPRKIEDVMAGLIETKGMAAAAEEYKSLRKEYYGGYSYDFSDFPLNSLARRLTKLPKLDEALAVIGLNSEYYPDSLEAILLGGEVYRLRGDKEKAIQSFKRLLELDPANRFATMRLGELTQTEKP